MSTLILGLGSINISCKIPKGIVLAHLRFKKKVLHEHLAQLSNGVAICISSPQQGVNINIDIGGGAPLISPEKFPTAKFLPTCDLIQ